jgi:branched-chain amino acid transport system substrate-binding protein
MGILFLPSLSPAAGTIKVGIVDTFSGPGGVLGVDALNGFRMGAGEINARGGLLGKRIEVVTRDDRYQPSVALSMAKELVLKERVDILQGTINSVIALAISDFARKEKIPFLSTGAKSEKLAGKKGHRYIFQMNETTAMLGKAVAKVLAGKPYLRYWIAGDDYEFGHALTNAIWSDLKKLNPKVRLAGQTWWKLGETDFNPYIDQIVSAKPDFIIIGCSGASVFGFQKAAKAAGLADKVPFYQHTAMEFSVLSALGLEQPEGVLSTANYMWYYPQTPENRAFFTRYLKIYGKYPTQPSFYGYAAALFIAKAYQKAGTTDTERFVDALETAVLDSSPIGRLQIRRCDHQLQMPTYVGLTKKVPEYKNFLVGTDIVAVSAKETMPSCEEIRSERK